MLGIRPLKAGDYLLRQKMSGHDKSPNGSRCRISAVFIPRKLDIFILVAHLPLLSNFLLAYVVDVIDDCSVFDLFDHLVDDEQRHEEPFARDDGVTEAIFDLDVQFGRFKKPMQQVFELRAVDIGKVVGGHDLDISHQKCRVEFSVGKTLVHIATGDADFMDDIPMFLNHRVFGLASQDVDRSAGDIALLHLVREQRACRWVGNSTTGFIFV